MSWAAHEFENYIIQKHTGLKVSFLAIVLGMLSSDLFTKSFVYSADDPAAFHRGWPGVGFTHSLLFGFVLAILVLGVTRSRSWALGILIGQWAHVLTDVADSAGVMLFFPFSTEPFSINMWKHAAAEGPNGDAVAYYSSLGGVWDFAWLVVFVLVARETVTRRYFRDVIVPADPRVWGWLHRRLHLSAEGLLMVYRGLLFYGLGRMVAWFLFARLDVAAPFQPLWGGPDFVEGNYVTDLAFPQLLARTAIGGVLFGLFLVLCWFTFVRRLWDRGVDPPAVERGKGLAAVFGDDRDKTGAEDH